jgi:hypothetical protein
MRAWVLAAFVLSAGPVPGTSQQDYILRRTFAAGDEWRYHIRLVVRSELEGPETIKIGAVTYVKTVQHGAEARLGWMVTERVTRLAENGAAEVREQQEAFEPIRVRPQKDEDDPQAARLAASLRQMLSNWSKGRALELHVTANGSVIGLAADAAPQLDEPAPPLLTLWLAHALRPAAVLPERRIRVGEPWQEPRDVRVSGWTDVHAGETGEWLEAAGTPGIHAALQLHVVQEISGRVNDSAPPASEAGNMNGQKSAPAREKTERFFAESLSTIGIEDGRVLSASRSARKEVIQILTPVSGMTERPRFRATLSVQVEIESCVENPCEGGNR